MQKKGIGFLVIVMIAGLAGSLVLVLESARAQSRTGKSTIVLNVTSGREDVHAATMALQLANHALDDGRAAVLFLNVRAPDLARRDLPDSLVLQGNPPIRRMVAELITRGADVLVCPSCARVMGVNRETKRIALSLKRLRPNQWLDVESRYYGGQVIEGVVTNVVSFGAFVRVEEGVEGLVHISELAEGSFLHPRNVVREGDAVRVKVLNVDSANQRLGLSLRQANDAYGRSG